MIRGDDIREPAAWGAADQRWYAEMVVQCMGTGESHDAIDVPTVLAQVAAMPVDECLHMCGDAGLDNRFEDSAHTLWSHDRHGRWFANLNGQKQWLGPKLAALCYGPVHVPSELKASHICGHCDCIRWQHIRFQSRREDVLDREHHQLNGNVIRPELRALLVAESESSPAHTPNLQRDLRSHNRAQTPACGAQIGQADSHHRHTVETRARSKRSRPFERRPERQG